MAKTGVINARVEQDIRDRLEQYCKDNQIKMAVIVETALSEWLDNHESEHLHTSVQHNAHNTTQCTQNSTNQTQQEIESLKAEMEGLKAEINSHREDLTVHWGIIHQTNKDIQRLQDTYPEFVEMTKTNKQTLRDLKYETQKLKNSKASMNDIHNLEVVLNQKLDQQQLDERLAMATMPIWGEIDSDVQNRDRENIPSESPPETTEEVKPYQLSFNEDNPLEEAKSDQSEDKSQNSDEEGLSSTELAKTLNIPKTYITNWKKTLNIPSEKSKYHKAYQEWLKWELCEDGWHKKPTS